MNHYCKVVFYAEDMKLPTKICEAKFRSTNTADRFVNKFSYFGGFLRFSVDIYEDEVCRGLPLIPCNFKGFKAVYKLLYDDLPI